MGKFGGAMLVIGAGSALGLLASQNLAERCRLLKFWLWALEIIKTEINFQASLLPEILKRIAGMADDAQLSQVFLRLAGALSYGAALDFAAAWQQCLDDPVWRRLKAPEKEILQELGGFLGSTGRMDQNAKINAYQMQLQQLYQLAQAQSHKQSGLYRYLGFAAGATLVLWLG